MGKQSRVLLVDDDIDILELVGYNLEKEGLKVRKLSEGGRALEIISRFKPDLIILDIMMPGMNGLDLCKVIRNDPHFENTFIFFLTARSDLYDRESAFEMGGDDYIEKTVGLRALINKVVTVVKRKFTIRKREQVLTLKRMVINRKTGRVALNGVEIALTRHELELLFFFAQNPRKIITKENLLCNVWGFDLFAMTHSIETHVRNLISKIGANHIVEVTESKYIFRP